MMLKFYIWVMGWSGEINSWAWRKHAKILRTKQSKELPTVRDKSINLPEVDNEDGAF